MYLIICLVCKFALDVRPMCLQYNACDSSESNGRVVGSCCMFSNKTPLIVVDSIIRRIFFISISFITITSWNRIRIRIYYVIAVDTGYRSAYSDGVHYNNRYLKPRLYIIITTRVNGIFFFLRKRINKIIVFT